MRRMSSRILTAAAAALLLAGALFSSSCAPKPAPRKHFATCAATQPEQPPIVVLSQAGPPLPRPGGDPSQPVGEEDRIVFAAWPDCAVVFREGPALKIGRVPAERINELLSAIIDAGFFKPP